MVHEREYRKIFFSQYGATNAFVNYLLPSSHGLMKAQANFPEGCREAASTFCTGRAQEMQKEAK